MAIAYQVFQELQKTKNEQPQNSTKIQEALDYATWFSMKTISAIKGACVYSNEWGGQKNAIYTGVALAAISQAITGSSPFTNIQIAATSAAILGIFAKALNNGQKIPNETPLAKVENPQLAISFSPPSLEEINEGAGISEDKKEEHPKASVSDLLMSAPLLNPTETTELARETQEEKKD